MVWYVLLVAVLNLGVGFAVAVYAGRRYRELCVLAVEAAIPAEAFPVSASQPPTPASPAADDGPDESTGDEAPAEASSPDTQSAAHAPPAPERQVSPSEACLEQFKNEVEQYRQELMRLDNAFRACSENPDAGAVKSFVSSLRKANEKYLASREPPRRALQELDAEPGDLQSFFVKKEALQATVGQQDAQMEDTRRAVEGLDEEGDLAEGCRRMVDEITKLLRANHSLRDALEEAWVAVARNDGRLASIDEAKRNDPLTALSSRAGLETSLAEWWKKDPHRLRQLSAAMIDVDELGQLNERYGEETGNRLLRAVARLLTSESRNHLLVARFSGQRFVLLFADVDVRFATNVVERVRQTIEMSRLEYRKEEIRLTVSCAAIEVTPEDTPDTLYARADATLREAKRYGRNRTFVHEGRYPTPVVPPNFTLEERSVTV